MNTKNKKLMIVIGCILAAGFLSMEGIQYVYNKNTAQNRPLILIDAGHGGSDPGKVGIGDVLEKDINLEIAKKLKLFLEKNDITVVMTRDKDTGLYEASDKNKKNADLRRRRELIQQNQPNAVISVHQNSFPSASEKGAQVFYYTSSPESKQLAENIQNQFLVTIDSSNRRQAKANDSYYLLKTNVCPMVIVECGFLSNPEETANLSSSLYQEKVAWTIHLGVLKFLSLTDACKENKSYQTPAALLETH